MLATELLGIGRPSGGVGVSVRLTARELARRGFDVTVLLGSQRQDIATPVVLDGFHVIEYPRSNLRALARLSRATRADIYHSVQASIGARAIQKAVPDGVHVVELIDPRNLRDWSVTFRQPTLNWRRTLLPFLYFELPAAKRAPRRAARTLVPAQFIAEKAQRKYKLKHTPEFVPSPVVIPSSVRKADQPTVCFVARLDRVKKPHHFVDLARTFPHVQFIMVGTGFDNRYVQQVTASASDVSNLTMTGFLDPTRDTALTKIFGSAWILVNLAEREGLPISFIEAAAHRIAILAMVDPDGFVSHFGYQVNDGDFATGLRWLLEQDRWRALGERGFQYVQEHHRVEVTVDRLISIYAAASTCSRA
jgi:glycosyltransferase involved in cell wall biosynthesis